MPSFDTCEPYADTCDIDSPSEDGSQQSLPFPPSPPLPQPGRCRRNPPEHRRTHQTINILRSASHATGPVWGGTGRGEWGGVPGSPGGTGRVPRVPRRSACPSERHRAPELAGSRPEPERNRGGTGAEPGGTGRLPGQGWRRPVSGPTRADALLEEVPHGCRAGQPAWRHLPAASAGRPLLPPQPLRGRGDDCWTALGGGGLKITR